MIENNTINYEKALFSVAMIDLKTYTETISTIDQKLEDPNFILNYVLKQAHSEDMISLLNDHAFVHFAKVQQYLKDVQKSILKYQKRLASYLKENPNANDEFNTQLNILIPLFEEKEKFVNLQIKKCFEYNKSNCEDLSY